MMTPQLLIFETHKELFSFAAMYVAHVAQQAVEERGRFLMTLAGGGTPQPLYELLADTAFMSGMPWAQTHVFWGDERCVPPDEAGSNFGQAKGVLLDKVAIPAGNIHPINGTLPPQASATDYANTLAQFADSGLAWPRFDLVLLGMGSDGHTASLFPGSAPAGQTPTLAVTATYQDRPANRVTLTPAVFNTAHHTLFLVTGASKAPAISAIHGSNHDEKTWPAQRIQPEKGKLLWLLDRPAGQHLLEYEGRRKKEEE